MREVSINADDVRLFTTSLQLYTIGISEEMSNMQQTYRILDDEWDDTGKYDFLDSLQKTISVLRKVNEAMSNAQHDLSELAMIIEDYVKL